LPRILVVAPNWIGDALMAQPLLARLREKRPGVRIDALAPARVAPVMRRMPEVADVIEAPFHHGALQLGERWRVGRGLRGRYDQAIVLPNTWKSGLAPFFADIPIRSGYVGESRFGLLNLTYRNPKARGPMAQHYARLSERPGKEPPEPLPQPQLKVDTDAAEATARRFGLTGRFAAFCPGAEYGPAKRWPGYAALAGRLHLPVVVLGAAGDRDACAGIAGRHLEGETTLDEAIELIACADVVVSNDSGLMHVAAAVGTPLVAVFGSSSPRHTPPLSAHARVIWLGLDCSPCFARDCPLGHLRCLREISPERVLAEIRNLGSE
jgi:heptosyltransferase-2